MVKWLLMLIPPMGHDSQFYSPLREALRETMPNDLELVTPDYPDMEQLVPLEIEEILDFLAAYFEQQLQHHIETQSTNTNIAIGGVSLGGTLSIRINHLIHNKPKRIFLMASGGLKVSRARREIIQMAMQDRSAEYHVLKSMAIDGDSYEQSSFPVQFQQTSPAIETYWNHQANMLKILAADQIRADSFVKLTQAALGVDYERHMEDESATYSILWSEQDKVFSKRMYRKFQKHAQQARFHLLDSIGHYAPLEDPMRIAKIIKQDLLH